jgi:protein transport protein SEC24
LLRPQSAFYKTFALECSRAQVSVDCHLFDTQKYIDVATIGQLSQLTGGTMYHYPEWNPVRDGEKFCRDIERNLTRTTGFEAVMRVRCSKGIRISSHYGNMFLRSSDLMALPNIDADKAFAVQMQLTENLSGAGPQVCLCY